MFKNMRLSVKISLGFATLLGIAIALGGMAVYNMDIAATEATKLADEYVPEVKIANNLRGAANRVMYQMRGYALSEDGKYYTQAQEEMKAVKTHLGEAEELSLTATNLKALKDQLATATKAVDAYEGLMGETDTTIDNMKDIRGTLDSSASSFMKVCDEYLAGQNAKFVKELGERVTKIEALTKIVELGSSVRVANFKAQATNDMSLMQSAADKLATIKTHTDVIRPITSKPEDIERLDTIESSAAKYAENIQAYIKTNGEMAAAGKRMDAAASAYMNSCNDFLAGQNQKMRKEFDQADADLEERLQKITLINDIIDTGNAARVGNFKAQAQQSAQAMQQTMEGFKKVKDIASDLRQITREDADIKRIKKTEEAADEYLSAMETYLGNFQQLAKHRKEMDAAAGQYVAVCGTYLEGQESKLRTGMTERHEKITLANDVIGLANDSRVKAFKAQATSTPALMQAAIGNFDEADKVYKDMLKITRKDVDIKRIASTKAAGDAYKTALGGFLVQWSTLQDLGKQRDTAGKSVIEACKATAEAGITATETISQEAATSLANSTSTMISGLIIAVIVGVIMALVITRGITKPFQNIFKGLKKFSTKELNETGTTFNRIIESLTTGVEQTTSAAGQVASASQSLAQGSSEQAASLEETTASMEEMSSMTSQNADNANEAKKLAETAWSSAEKGTEAMSRMSSAIDDIKTSSDETAKIIKTIDEIAFQTNLLALNAAVEAARAGEAGKGFAVVAEEVRNLAQRSAEAARTTADMIEGSVKNADNGVNISREVAETLSEIAEGSRKVNDLVGEISAASNEQSQGIGQISTAVTQMDQITQSNAANAEESASASEELSAQAEELSRMVGDLEGIVNGNDSQKNHHSATPGASTGGQSHSSLDAIKHLVEKRTSATPTSSSAPTNSDSPSPEELIPLGAEEELAKF